MATTASEEPSLEPELGTGLGDLPESSIASILGLLSSPRDVARTACVSRIFRAAADSDVVWQKMLPHFYADILADAVRSDQHATPMIDAFSSKKEVFNFLCNRVLLRNGNRDFWLDRASGASCQSIAAQELNVIWGEDSQYWKWCSQDGARFPEVACLLNVWWLDVTGRWEGRLLPGTYTLSWRLSMGKFYHTGSNGPVTFFFEASGNEPVSTECFLTAQGAKKQASGTFDEDQQQRLPLGYRWDGDSWMELDVGEFTVERDNSLVEIAFHLKDIDCNRMKRGLYIDCVMIRPSITTQNRIALSDLEMPFFQSRLERVLRDPPYGRARLL